MKKLFFAIILVSSMAVAGVGVVYADTATDVANATASSSTNAQGSFTALAPIPGLTDQSATSVINATSLANFFNNLYKYLIGLAAILAVIEIIWGGLEISTKDSVSKQSNGRERITQAIFGLVLVLSPVLVFSIINPNILNLSLNLPPLDTKSSTPSTATTTPPSYIGTSAANGLWCVNEDVNATIGTNTDVQAVDLCWPDQQSCAASKSSVSGYTIAGDAFCQQIQR